MMLPGDDHTVAALAADRPDDSFAVRILPRRARCDDDLLDVDDVLGAESQGKALIIWCPVQCAPGLSVTSKCAMRRRACSRTTKTYRRRKVAVGTTKKSMATISVMWLRRKVRQVWDGGFRVHGM